jgi:hypothetical protein
MGFLPRAVCCHGRQAITQSKRKAGPVAQRKPLRTRWRSEIRRRISLLPIKVHNLQSYKLKHSTYVVDFSATRQQMRFHFGDIDG